jgi:hypothetical protein
MIANPKASTAAIECREGARSCVAVAHAVGSAALGLGFALNLTTECGVVPGSRRADRRRRLDNAALRPILRRDDGEGYRELLTRMAQESGIETPTAEDLPRVDRKWKGKTPPNADWKNRPIRKRRICVKGLLGLQPRAIKPRRHAPAAERFQSLSRVVVGDDDRCGANPCLLGKLRFPIVGLALLIPAMALQQPNRGRRGRSHACFSPSLSIRIKTDSSYSPALIHADRGQSSRFQHLDSASGGVDPCRTTA